MGESKKRKQLERSLTFKLPKRGSTNNFSSSNNFSGKTKQSPETSFVGGTSAFCRLMKNDFHDSDNSMEILLLQTIKTTNIDTLNTEYRDKKPKTLEELNELLLLSPASDIAISIVKNNRSTTKRNEYKDGNSSIRNLSLSPLNSNSSATINTITMGNNRKPKPNGNTQNVL